MTFCTYNLCIACYFLYVQFRKSVIFVRTILHILAFCTYNFGVFYTLYVQFCPLFMKNIGLIWKFSKGKNCLKTVKNRYYLEFSKYFCTYKKCVFGVFLGYFSHFLPILWPFCPLLYPLLTIYEFYKYICKK